MIATPVIENRSLKHVLCQLDNCTYSLRGTRTNVLIVSFDVIPCQFTIRNTKQNYM
jgi:hypothetical protein